MTLAIQKAESDVALDVKTVMERQLAAFEARLKADFDARFAVQEARLGQRIDVGLAALRTEIAGSEAEILHWNFSYWVAQLAALAAIVKLLK